MTIRLCEGSITDNNASSGFRVLDHTADVGIAAFGPDLQTAFANAAKGMFSLIVDLDTVLEIEGREIAVTAPDREALLVEWLNDLLFLFDSESLVFRSFRVLECSESSLHAVVTGERLDPQRHRVKLGIKAVTYHKLSVSGGPPYEARVILDV